MMLSAPISSSLQLLLGSTSDEYVVGAVELDQQLPTHVTGVSATQLLEVGELETYSSQMCAAITDQDYTHPAFKRLSPTFRHYAYDNGCFAGFNSEKGYTMQEIFLSRQQYAGPGHWTEFLGSHCVKMQTTVDAKMRSVSTAEIYVFFYAGGMLIEKMSEGVTVFTWVKRQDEWICVKSTTLRHCWSVDDCLAVESNFHPGVRAFETQMPSQR